MEWMGGRVKCYRGWEQKRCCRFTNIIMDIQSTWKIKGPEPWYISIDLLQHENWMTEHVSWQIKQMHELTNSLKWQWATVYGWYGCKEMLIETKTIYHYCQVSRPRPNKEMWAKLGRWYYWTVTKRIVAWQ